MTPRKRFRLLMPKNIFIDLNIIVDVLIERSGFETSQSILQLGETDDCRLHISAHTVTTLAYLLEHLKLPQAKIHQQINWLLNTFHVVATTSQALHAAQKSAITDFEDAVVEQAAITSNALVIITRNGKDFK